MIDLTAIDNLYLIDLYGKALAEKLELVYRRRAMPYGTDESLVKAVENEINEQSEWIAQIEDELRKRNLLR